MYNLSQHDQKSCAARKELRFSLVIWNAKITQRTYQNINSLFQVILLTGLSCMSPCSSEPTLVIHDKFPSTLVPLVKDIFSWITSVCSEVQGNVENRSVSKAAWKNKLTYNHSLCAEHSATACFNKHTQRNYHDYSNVMKQ